METTDTDHSALNFLAGLLTITSPEASALAANDAVQTLSAEDERKPCDGDGLGFSTACLCRGCEVAAQRRYYAVICGLDVGVFEGWCVVPPLVIDFTC